METARPDAYFRPGSARFAYARRRETRYRTRRARGGGHGGGIMRVALVTGAGRGIGLACARALLRAGNRVVAADIAPPSPASFPEAQQDRLMPAALDVTDEAAAAALLAEVKNAWGPVGILVNNAGVSPKVEGGRSASLLEITPEEWETVLDVNLTAVLRLCRQTAPHMREQHWGRIVNMASLAGRARSRVAGVSYSSSKAALIGLTRILAGELGPWGVTSNSVAPGRILTDMVLQAGEAVNKAYAEVIPLQRLGRPEEVAAVVAFLASEDAGFVNGALIDVNGGSFMP